MGRPRNASSATVLPSSALSVNPGACPPFAGGAARARGTMKRRRRITFAPILTTLPTALERICELLHRECAGPPLHLGPIGPIENGDGQRSGEVERREERILPAVIEKVRIRHVRFL